MDERSSRSSLASSPFLALDFASKTNMAIEFLRRRQLPHGEFTTLLGTDKSLFKSSFDSSPFITSFIIYALTEFEDADVKSILKKAADFLASEMEFGGVWRYWSTRQHKHARLPPDVDDTACISYALQRAGYPVPDNKWILFSSRDSAGRFMTWLPPVTQNLLNLDLRLLLVRCLGCCQAFVRAKRNIQPLREDPRFIVMHIDRNDVDAIVNANAVLYVGECKRTLKAIQFVIDTTLSDAPDFSLYYEDHLALYYAAARAMRHSAPTLNVLREHIVSRTMRRVEEQGRLNILQTAMAASVMLTFDPEANVVEDLVRYILEAQREDGGWDAYPFYGVWGSEELTTAFCLEVLARGSRLRKV
jgi:hypothetical protein